MMQQEEVKKSKECVWQSHINAGTVVVLLLLLLFAIILLLCMFYAGLPGLLVNGGRMLGTLLYIIINIIIGDVINTGYQKKREPRES